MAVRGLEVGTARLYSEGGHLTLTQKYILVSMALGMASVEIGL